MACEKVRLDIVSGFLGAGKTTFIQKLIRDVYRGEKVAVLENEFGEISLDGETLARRGIAVESVRAGCICCTAAGELSQNILAIADRYRPDRIVIEPTGLALLSDVLALVREPPVAGRCRLGHVVTIVDAKNYDSRMMLSKEFFENQIKSSETVFLSRTVLLGRDRLAEIARRVREIHPGCTVVSQPWEQLDASQMEALLGGVAPEEEHPGAEHRCHHAERHHHEHGEEPDGPGGFESFAWEADAPVRQEEIQEFLERVQSCGEIHRAKGIFQDPKGSWFRFEYVPGEARILPLAEQMPQGQKKLQVCVIGTGLRKDLLRERFS